MKYKNRAYESDDSSPFVSFTELLVAALIIFILITIALALNQKGSIGERKKIEAEIEALKEQRYDIAKTVIEGKEEFDKIEEAKKKSEELLAKLNTQLEQAQSVAKQEEEKTLELQDERLVLENDLKNLLASVKLTTQEKLELQTKRDELRAQLADLNEQNPSERIKQQERKQSNFVEGIASQLSNAGLPARADKSVIRISNDVLFEHASSKLTSRTQRAAIKQLALTLQKVLRCYIRPQRCSNPDLIITAVLIEGHADKSGSDARNWELSMERAFAVYNGIISEVPELKDATLLSDNPKPSLFGLAGYGEQRPLVQTKDGVKEPANRRIEIRFIFDGN